MRYLLQRINPLTNISNDFLALLFDYALIFLMSINPFFTLAGTGEAAAIGHGYFFYTARSMGPVSFHSSLWLVSPWLTYALFYTLLALGLVAGTIQRVAKMSNQ